MLEFNSSLLVLALILLISLFGSILAGKLHKSNLIFYILFGLLTSKLILSNQALQYFVESLANLGIVLLLFTIGLELPLQKLFRAGRIMALGSLAQVIGVGIALSPIMFLLIKDWGLALLLGVTLAMSSTAVVGKLLQERAEDSSLTGEISLNILIFQDLMSVALITLLTFITSRNLLASNPWWLFGQKVLIVGVLFFVLTKIIEVVFSQLRLNREQLALFTFALLFSLIALFSYSGIPETTAGFMIGVLLAGRREQHEIFSQVRVFRDVLLVLFFFFLGTYLKDLNLILLFWGFWLALLVMIIKFIILWLIFLFLNLHQKTAFWVSFDLMQVGEFAFVLLSIMSLGNLFSDQISQLLMIVIIWTLLLFSLFYRSKLKLYRWFDRLIVRRFNLFENSAKKIKPYFDQIQIENHLVLCGYGRVGSYIGHGLILSQLPLIVIDTDADRIKRLLSRGVRAIYGDATEPEILDYAQVEKAKFLIVSVPSSVEQEQIILSARRLNPKIQILTRAHLSQNLRHFKALGVSQVIQPEFEAAITLLKKILKLYSFSKEEIKKRMQYLKMEHGIQS